MGYGWRSRLGAGGLGEGGLWVGQLSQPIHTSGFILPSSLGNSETLSILRLSIASFAAVNKCAPSCSY